MKEKIVLVEWEDASYNSGFYDKEKPKDFAPVFTRTVGHLIEANVKSVILSTDRYYVDGKIDSEKHISCIPRKMIKRFRYLK